MSTFLDYYEYSKLANAAYVDLTNLDGASIAAAANVAKRLPTDLANQTFDFSKNNGDPVWTESPRVPWRPVGLSQATMAA